MDQVQQEVVIGGPASPSLVVNTPNGPYPLLQLAMSQRYANETVTGGNRAEYYTRGVMQQAFTFNGTAAQNFTGLLPAWSRVVAVMANYDTAITVAGNTVGFGVGTSAHPGDLIVTSSTYTKNQQSVNVVTTGGNTDNSNASTGLQLSVYPVQSGGTSVGTGTITGTVYFVILYDTFQPPFPHP